MSNLMIAQMERVKCAVIGAGWWGTTSHVPALRDNPHADLVAIQHHDPQIAKRIAKDFDVAHACTTAEEVLAIDDLKAVAISSVPALHYEQGKAAIERGLHVLIEKPFTIRGDEAQDLVRLADEKGVHLMVGTTYHFTRHCQEARRILQSGVIGKVRMLSILFTNFTEGLYRGLEWNKAMPSKDEARSEHKPPYLLPGLNSYSDPKLAGGGQIYTQVSHPAAYISYLTDLKPIEVFARFEYDGANVDIYNAIVIVLDDGTLVSLGSNGAATTAKMHYEVRVHGTSGVLEQELWKGTLSIDGKDGLTDCEPLATGDTYPMYGPSKNLIDLSINPETTQNLSHGRHGAFASIVSEAAVESARTGRPIKIA